MKNRQFTTPMIVQNNQATRLYRVPFADKTFPEDWLQKLLFDHPHLIPVDEIEPAFGGLISVARELPTSAGPLDLLCINTEGHLTLVETKLWRNPEARREVVGQIIDYAKEMAAWSYDDLKDAVKKATGSGADADEDPLLKLGGENSDDFDQRDFVDRIQRNLRLGRFLLLIVGDGIREEVQRMADFLQGTPQLGFTLGLVEIALFRLHPNKDDPLFVQPRILARTREVTRAVVEVKSSIGPAGVSVTLPPDESNEKATRRIITEDEFYEELARVEDAKVVEFARWAVQEAPRHGLHVVWRSSGPAFHYVHPAAPQNFSLGNFLRSGVCWIGWLNDQCRKVGISENIGLDYFKEVASLIPGGSYRKGKVIKGMDNRDFRISALVPRGDEWFAAIDKTIQRIQEALGEE